MRRPRWWPAFPGLLAPSVTLILLGALCIPGPLADQEEWIRDLDLLLQKIEELHPDPWGRISRGEFTSHMAAIKERLGDWDDERTTLEVMGLVASLRDGHTRVRLNNKAGFDGWFPLRIEAFADGLFITATDRDHADLLRSQVLRFDRIPADEAYERVGGVLASDDPTGVRRVIPNFLSNAVVLHELGILNDRASLSLEVRLPDGVRTTASLTSEPWQVAFNWAYRLDAIPSHRDAVSIYAETADPLPLFLINVVSGRAPYWFIHIPRDRLLYFQWNEVTSDLGEPLDRFTQRMFSVLDENADEVDAFVVDLRFNEGGNGYLLPPMIQEFIRRGDELPRGKLFLITGSRTFSAASNFIGQMVKNTSAITVGDIASGPLNWYSDILKIRLPNTNTLVDISTMAWQEGHATDARGYYPPDVYVPEESSDLFAFRDPALAAIQGGRAVPLKDLLIRDGTDAFEAEYARQTRDHPEVRRWWPYVSFDMTLFIFQDLFPAGRVEEARAFARLNTELYPEDRSAWYILAMTLEAAGDLEGALGALDRLAEIEPLYAEAMWDRSRLQATLNPAEVALSTLGLYAGTYGSRTVTLQEETLFCEREGGIRQKLIPVDQEVFLLDGSNSRVRFLVKDGGCQALEVFGYTGTSTTYPRTVREDGTPPGGRYAP